MLQLSQQQKNIQNEHLNQRLNEMVNCLNKYKVEIDCIKAIEEIAQQIKASQNNLLDIMRQNDVYLQQQKFISCNSFVTCKTQWQNTHNQPKNSQQVQPFKRTKSLFNSKAQNREKICKKNTVSQQPLFQFQLNDQFDTKSQQFLTIRTIKTNSERQRPIVESQQNKSKYSNPCFIQQVLQSEQDKLDPFQHSEANQPLVTNFKQTFINQSHQNSAFIGSEIPLSEYNLSQKDQIMKKHLIQNSSPVGLFNINSFHYQDNQINSKHCRKSKLRLKDLKSVNEIYRSTMLKLINLLLSYFIKEHQHFYGKRFVATKNLQRLARIYNDFKRKTQINWKDYERLINIQQKTEHGLVFLEREIKIVLDNQITRLSKLKVSQSINFSIKQYDQ